MKTILFRSNSSSSIGTGHIMRDLVLASRYKNANIIFGTQNLKGNINHKILEAGYTLHVLKSNSKKELLKLLKSLDVDILVIDSYDIDYKIEKYIKTRIGIKILAFDDTYEKHYCDILLNHNMSANRKKYKDLVPATCMVRCGAKYTLLRDEFYKEKAKRYKKNTKTTYLVAMGGADTANLNIKILKVLDELENIKVNIITTKANKRVEELLRYVKNKKYMTLHVESSKIAKLMAKSDLAIITPSVILNEVFFMQLPFIAIKTTPNQNDMYRYIKKKGYSVLKKFNAKELKKELDENR